MDSEEAEDFRAIMVWKEPGKCSGIAMVLALSLLPIGVTLLILGANNGVPLLIAGVAMVIICMIILGRYWYLYKAIEIGYRECKSGNFEEYIVIRRRYCLCFPCQCSKFEKPPGAGNKINHKIIFEVKPNEIDDSFCDVLCCTDNEYDRGTNGAVFINVGDSIKLTLVDESKTESAQHEAKVAREGLQKAIESGTVYEHPQGCCVWFG